MAFEEIKENVEAIQDHSKAYIESTIAYYKLWGFKVAMKSTTLMVKFFLIAFFLMIVMLFVSIAGALALIFKLAEKTCQESEAGLYGIVGSIPAVGDKTARAWGWTQKAHCWTYKDQQHEP